MILKFFYTHSLYGYFFFSNKISMDNTMGLLFLNDKNIFKEEEEESSKILFIER